MKRLLLLLISFIFIFSFTLSGCSDPDRKGELREFLSSNEDAYSEAFPEEESEFSAFADYMKQWAAVNDVDVAFEGEHAIVLKNSATEGFKSEPSCVLLCGFNTQNASGGKAVISTAQTALLGPTEHGDISLAITERAGTQLIGIDELPAEYLTADSLISLNTGNNNTILTAGPVAAKCSFLNTGTYEPSTYDQAFAITFSMPEYTDPFDFVKDNNYPNPINTIGSFLASSKSAGKLFHIASFTSKDHAGYAPYYAKAVIVVDSNNIESLKSRFEKSYSNMEDKFEDLEAEFEYTMEETDMPEKVLSDELADNLVSLMYTLNTGVCQQDEESGLIYAASYIKSISTKEGDLELKMGIRARGESYLDSLSAEYETTAGLCSTKYEFSKSGRIWATDEKSSLVQYFTGCVPLQGPAETAVSLRTYENDLIAKDLPDQEMIIYTFEKGDRKTVLENLVDYTDPSIQK
ncbi:MAG: hypothetical protein K6B42_07085 [Clostridia bacterium]|nr:hypothetical protein [Clostridia bacterium]